MHKPRHETPPPSALRDLSPAIRTYAAIGCIGELRAVSEMYDALTGRKPLAKPENAALFAILSELRRVAGHPDPVFDELRRLIDDLEYLKCSAEGSSQ